MQDHGAPCRVRRACCRPSVTSDPANVHASRSAYNRRMGLEPIFRVAQIRAIESANAAAPLMERAGLAAATIARDLLAERSPRALVLAGPGNNGGDAFVVARLLRSWFFDVIVAFSGDAARLPPDAARPTRHGLQPAEQRRPSGRSAATSVSSSTDCSASDSRARWKAWLRDGSSEPMRAGRACSHSTYRAGSTPIPAPRTRPRSVRTPPRLSSGSSRAC